MAYETQTWQTGDTITAQKLNHMEDGIADSDLFIVTFTASVESDALVLSCDKTFAEVSSAVEAGKTIIGKWYNEGQIVYLAEFSASEMGHDFNGGIMSSSIVESGGEVTFEYYTFGASLMADGTVSGSTFTFEVTATGSIITEYYTADNG